MFIAFLVFYAFMVLICFGGAIYLSTTEYKLKSDNGTFWAQIAILSPVLPALIVIGIIAYVVFAIINKIRRRIVP